MVSCHTGKVKEAPAYSDLTTYYPHHDLTSGGKNSKIKIKHDEKITRTNPTTT